MPHWLRTQYWSVSIVTTGTVWTHSPLHPSCRVWGDRKCSNYLSNAGMNVFATMHSSAVLPHDVTGHDHTCISLPILWPHLLSSLTISTSLAYVQILQSARFPCQDLCTCHSFHLDCFFASWVNFCLSCRSQGVVPTPSIKVKVLVLISIFFFVIFKIFILNWSIVD